MKSLQVRRAFIACFFFLLPAVFHALALQWPDISVPESPETHSLFVIINGGLGLYLISYAEFKLPPLFFFALGALTIHQVIVHFYLAVMAIRHGGFDIQSFMVLVAFVPLWQLMLTEPKEN
jgi:hypothetical protein